MTRRWETLGGLDRCWSTNPEENKRNFPRGVSTFSRKDFSAGDVLLFSYINAVKSQSAGLISTLHDAGELSVDPSVASNTLMSSTRHWAQFVSGRPRPGFTSPAIVPNITRWVGCPLVVRCTVDAPRRNTGPTSYHVSQNNPGVSRAPKFVALQYIPIFASDCATGREVPRSARAVSVNGPLV